MAQNWLRITHQDDKIQLSWQREQSAPRSAPPVNFEHPFDEQTLTELRWYLEEYLPFPYGIFPEQAQKIEQKFQEWGQQLFELVFPRTTKAWDFFQEATREGLDKCEINISSDDPKVLNLPWELLYSPDYQFLAPSLRGMYRSLNGYAVRSPLQELPQDKLNILLVVSRPYGEKDVALKTIARPLLEALKPIQKYVNLKVLRPPSFEAFEQELNAHKGFYHIVHFDGHGDFDENSTGFQHSYGSKGQGVLVFENTDGSPQIITAAQIAQSLNDCRVPIFVLNACKSAQEGDGSFSSVATRLVSLGTRGVVAMAYKVQAEAAKHFIGRFYQQLITGTDVSNAVAAARRQVINQRLRPSPKGDLPLADWMVPVLYQQETYTPFTKLNHQTEDFTDIDDFLAEPVSNLFGFPEQGRYGFIGRDYDILRLERAFRQNNIVLLQGMGGVGKTELTTGFAQWLDETQGRKQIFFTSFESGASLSRVINEVGRVVWGDKFSQYDAAQQQRAVLKYLQSQPCLLIWDNFEPVNGFPTGNEPLLSAEERNNLKQFLKELQGGKSWVLITSRREEPWLDCGYSLINLQGLSQVDAQELAAKILQTVGVERKNLPAEYLELLKLLGGNPLSLRAVLRHLRTQTPMQLIEALRQGLDTFQGAEEEGKDKSLTVSLDYAFSKLSEKAKLHLPFLALLCDRVAVPTLLYFINNGEDEFGQLYRAVFGENLKKLDWMKILNEAVNAGILEFWDEDIYKIHPTLPWYLRQKLNNMISQEKIIELEKKLLLFYALFADNFREKLVNNADMSTFVLEVEEANLLHNLRLAEQRQEWTYARLILQAVGSIYYRSGRKAEFKSLRQRALKQVGIRLVDAKIKGKNALDFWIFLRGIDANEMAQNNDLEGARIIYQSILDELTVVNNPSVDKRIAISNHNLGYLAQEKRQFDVAVDYYLRAQKIFEDAGDLYSATSVYHQLGMVAQEQEQFYEAIDYYLKSFNIRKEAGDFYSAARDYAHLGIVAEEQKQFDKAVVCYLKVLKIFEDAQDLSNAATVYHQLGLVAQKQMQFDKAVDNYLKAVKIYEDAEDFYNAAREYYHLGMVAQEQRQFDDAINYYQKTWEVCKQFRDWRKGSSTLSQWAKVLEAQEQYSNALLIYIGVLALDIEHNQEWISSDIYDLARILKQLGESQFQVIWLKGVGEECAGEVREAIWTARDRLG